jgi:rhamnose transport system substrate-binding protein
MALTVGVMPKSTRNPYFEDCAEGAREAAHDLGFTLLWDGPPDSDADAQARLVESWTREGIKAIAVSVESPARLRPALAEARARGIRVLTWDADADRAAREFTVVPATPAAVAHALAFEVGRITGGAGAVAGITSTLSAANQNAWIAEFRARLGRDHPGLEVVEIRPCDDLVEKARREALSLLEAHPQLRAIVGFCSPAVPGAAEAIAQARREVRVTGASLPALCRPYLENGAVDSVVFWRARDLGYLAAAAAAALADGSLEPGAAALKAGRLGNVLVLGDEIRLGRCHIVTRGNLDAFA